MATQKNYLAIFFYFLTLKNSYIDAGVRAHTHTDMHAYIHTLICTHI